MTNRRWWNLAGHPKGDNQVAGYLLEEVTVPAFDKIIIVASNEIMNKKL